MKLCSKVKETVFKHLGFLKVEMNTLFGKKSPTTLDVSGIGTCTGHADVKVDIAVRLAGVFLLRPQFLVFLFTLFSPDFAVLRPWRCTAAPFPPSRTRSAPAWPATPGCDWRDGVWILELKPHLPN